MPDRHLPLRPSLVQLKHQAKDLLRTLRRRDPTVKLAAAQLELARIYGVRSWPRLVQACQLIDAIHRDDAGAVRALVTRHPYLLVESARGFPDTWGPPMSYAANLGRDRLVTMLHALGATDLQHAFDRACLRGQIATARRLCALGATPERGAVMGPAESLDDAGLAFLLELGVPIEDAGGRVLAPVALVLQTYTRRPAGKHRCLELFAAHGVALPDTPVLALHRGRIDLLARHVDRDPSVLHHRFTHAEIYPPELGCDADPSLALHGTPLAGTTLLHQAIDFDELDLARWLIERGADVDARAAIDGDGFGGHTPLFHAVVSQAHRTRPTDAYVRLLLEHGADPTIRASLRKALRFHDDDTLHVYRDVTARAWGERFHGRAWVADAALALLREPPEREVR